VWRSGNWARSSWCAGRPIRTADASNLAAAMAGVRHRAETWTVRRPLTYQVRGHFAGGPAPTWLRRPRPERRSCPILVGWVQRGDGGLATGAGDLSVKRRVVITSPVCRSAFQPAPARRGRDLPVSTSSRSGKAPANYPFGMDPGHRFAAGDEADHLGHPR
jgi:hypothetical protein